MLKLVYTLSLVMIVNLTMLPTKARAQQDNTTQQRVEMMLGKLFVENANLVSTIDSLNKQIADLKRQLSEKDKEAKK